MMMLEELEGVGVEWEEDDKGRKVARFVVSDSQTEYEVSMSGSGLQVTEDPESQPVFSILESVFDMS
jgi:hypothetical protein